jgi:multidrug efflux pump subunit AcrB
MGGFVPLIAFGGTFWPPLATAIAGGVGGSVIIALYTVPAIVVPRPIQSAKAAS